MYVKGQKVDIKDLATALKYGIGFLTEDRRADGLALNLPIKTNVNMNSYDMISTGGVISLKKRRRELKNIRRMSMSRRRV